MRCIIPAAGFGTRMNMRPDESKEMLIDTSGRYIIDYSIDLCHRYGFDPIVITRAEKTDLISYCKRRGIETLIIEPKGEWPNTVLASYSKWDTRNLLMLPDTRFKPEGATLERFHNMFSNSNCDVIFATHNVEDISKWGAIEYKRACEKPEKTGPGRAWGLIGFRREAGIDLFTGFNRRDNWVTVENVGIIELDSFKDITRTGTLI